MRFTQDSNSSTHTIRGYGAGELRVDDTVYRGAIIVSASAVLHLPDVQRFEQLAAVDPSAVLQLEPEVVLVGTGSRHIFPPPEFAAAFLSRGIGFEVMNTGAACRTFNVLTGERRRVAALLWIE